MKRSVIIIILTAIGLYSCGQNDKPTPLKDAINVDTIAPVTLNETLIKTIDFSRESYIHTEADYTDTKGNGIVIQNSYPRGGGTMHTPSELQYGHAVFWSRVINKGDKALELNIQFPADSFLILPVPHTHFRLLVPSDTMTVEKASMFNFGLEGIETFVESNFHQTSQINRTILPNEETIFYVILLSYLPPSGRGVFRTGLFLEGQDLFYKLTVNPSVSKLLPCGRITYIED